MSPRVAPGRSRWRSGTAISLLGLCAVACAREEAAAPEGTGSTDQAVRLRAERLGPDDTPILELRVTVATGTVNGAGTRNPVLIWLNNRRYGLSSEPSQVLEAGQRLSTVLMGPGIPATLGELRGSSIVLALHLNRAEIGTSWYCESALVEVLLEGADGFEPYLQREPVGWLSLDEPPRRSTQYALQ